MCGSSPKPPDPIATAQAQATYNTEAAKDAATLNAINQYGPFGSTTYDFRTEGEFAGTPGSQTVTLSPQVQDWLNSQFGASTSLQNAAQTQLGYLPQDRFQLPTSPGARDIAVQSFGEGALDYSNFADPLADPLYQSQRQNLADTPSTQDIAATFYDQAKSRFQPDLDDARKQKEIELARRGIPIGSEIYNDEMNRLDRNQNNLYSDAARQAELAAGQEQSRQFGQNLSTAQYGAGEDARLAGADLSNRQFLGTQQNQQFNQLQAALGFGSNQYQTDLSNQLLERNQPYAEAAALLGTTPNFQTPSFMSTGQQSIAAPDYQGQVNTNYAQQVAQNQGIWSALGGIGAGLAGNTKIFSDEDLKEDRMPADGEAILMSFRDMPVDEFRYRDEAQEMYGLPEHRTGTMAQDWQMHFGGDGETIDIGDALGKLMAAMKALDRRTAGMRRSA